MSQQDPKVKLEKYQAELKLKEGELARLEPKKEKAEAKLAGLRKDLADSEKTLRAYKARKDRCKDVKKKRKWEAERKKEGANYTKIQKKITAYKKDHDRVFNPYNKVNNRVKELVKLVDFWTEKVKYSYGGIFKVTEENHSSKRFVVTGFEVGARIP